MKRKINFVWKEKKNAQEVIVNIIINSFEYKQVFKKTTYTLTRYAVLQTYLNWMRAVTLWTRSFF